LLRVVRDSIRAEGGVIEGSDIPVGAGVMTAEFPVDDEEDDGEEDDDDIGAVPGFVHPDTVINADTTRMTIR